SHGFVLPFEVVSMLLLAAMVGCIVIAMKTPEQKQAAIRTVPVQPELPVNIEELINTTITKKETPEEV
ncbi:MAG TPA: hypothetical protein VJ499_14775, partial [Flavisolibacter sp.]|nr:hypothetical protein [Flavisolibacter sp.]